MKWNVIAACLLISITGCTMAIKDPVNFGQDVKFLQKHVQNVVILQNSSDSSRVVITGDYQARVMTSTVGGNEGKSFGWINYPLVASGKPAPHINAFGGEERFWLGPEGGQYSLFFPKGKSFEFDNWQTPGLIDTAHYTVQSQSATAVTYQYAGTIQNYSGASFKLDIHRTIRLLDINNIQAKLPYPLPAGIRSVAYETENRITNMGDSAWNENNGLLSIWLLGMFKPSDQTIVVVPFKPGTDARSHITDDYFGKIPPQNLLVKDSILLFRADGKARGKLGISPLIARSGAGSIDPENKTLTVLFYEIVPQGRYVNSKWELQKEPFKGDAVNAYNDGPLADGKQLGPFYEIESSSDARALQPGESLVYRQVTMHFEAVSRHALYELALKLWDLYPEDAQQFIGKK